MKNLPEWADAFEEGDEDCEDGKIVKKMIMSNMPEDATEKEIKDLFGSLRYETIHLVPGKYAVITFEDGMDAWEAEKELDGFFWDGRYLRVKPARW